MVKEPRIKKNSVKRDISNSESADGSDYEQYLDTVKHIRHKRKASRISYNPDVKLQQEYETEQ